ncbi:MAG: hypothetical protein H7281_05490 [Bacteriovorax sp.]|nr:hypothetical protein [Bacteriovorax sp.]
MKRIFKILVVVLALGALVQTIALAKVKTGESSDSSTSKGTDGPGI